MVNRLEGYDHRVMRRVNAWRPPRWVRVLIVAATRGGDGWVWYAVGLAVAFWGGSLRLPALEVSTVSTIAGILVFYWLKRLCDRKRPSFYGRHAWYELLPPDRFSFPSGHSVTAFAVAVSLAYFYPHVAPVLFFLAFVVAASRVLLGLHFLTDVFAGASIGAIIGASAVHLFRAAGGVDWVLLYRLAIA